MSKMKYAPELVNISNRFIEEYQSEDVEDMKNVLKVIPNLCLRTS